MYMYAISEQQASMKRMEEEHEKAASNVYR